MKRITAAVTRQSPLMEVDLCRYAIFLSVLTLGLMMHPLVLWGAPIKSIEIEWEYTPPPGKSISSYQIYQDGTPVCRSTYPGIRTLNCRIDTSEKKTIITMDAEFTDRTRSPLSAPYLLKLPQNLNLYPILRIVLGEN